MSDWDWVMILQRIGTVGVWFSIGMIWWARRLMKRRFDQSFAELESIMESHSKVAREQLALVSEMQGAFMFNAAAISAALGISGAALYDERGMIRLNVLYEALGKEPPETQTH